MFILTSATVTNQFGIVVSFFVENTIKPFFVISISNCMEILLAYLQIASLSHS